MFDNHEELNKYYFEKVKLQEKDKSRMRERRDTNRARLDIGLKNSNSPKVQRRIIQGSYAMWTMIQKPDNSYDIDDGAVFTKESLQGDKGGDMSALSARQMVAAALKDARFNKEPAILPNCVRVEFNEGYHIDVPVYRSYEEDGSSVLELAGSDWRESDPQLITTWFNELVKEKSPEDDPQQLRRIVCLLKKWGCSRSTWNLPNGLIFSAYCELFFVAKPERDDEALVIVLEGIHQRLSAGNYSVPFQRTGEAFASGREAKIKALKQELDDKLGNLTSVIRRKGCTKNEALRAWRDFFYDDYFLSFVENEDEGSKKGGGLFSLGAPAAPVTKKGEGRYA